MNAYKYKHFLLRAFAAAGIKDLTGLADEYIFESAFNLHELNKLKIGTGYAMEIFYRKIEDESCDTDITYDELEDMKRIIDDVISAQIKKEVSDLIDEFMVYELKYLHKERR